MNPEVKKLWVEALRSDQYEQTQRSLHTDKGFCCLGVLADIYINQHGLEWTGREHLEETTYCFPDSTSTTYLPDNFNFKEWSGYIPDYTEEELADYNDALGLTFEQIANWIEQNL